jgi:hypothetical protein
VDQNTKPQILNAKQTEILKLKTPGCDPDGASFPIPTQVGIQNLEVGVSYAFTRIDSLADLDSRLHGSRP